MSNVTGFESDGQQDITIPIVTQMGAELIDVGHPLELLPNVDFPISCIIKNPNNSDYMMYARVINDDGNVVLGGSIQHFLIPAGNTHQFNFIIAGQTGTSFSCKLDYGRVTDIEEE